MDSSPYPRRQSFNKFGKLSTEVRDRIIDIALPTVLELQNHNKPENPLAIGRYYKRCGRKSIAILATVNRQWQDRVERLLFRDLTVDVASLRNFEWLCGAGRRSLLVRKLEIRISFFTIRNERWLEAELGRSLDFDHLDFNRGQPPDGSREVVAYVLAMVFDVLKHWDRSNLQNGHLLALELCTLPSGNFRLDCSNFPLLPVVGELIINKTVKTTSLYPSTLISLIQRMPRLSHTSISFLDTIPWVSGSEGM